MKIFSSIFWANPSIRKKRYLSVNFSKAKHGNAYEIAVSGIPYFSLGYVFFALNIVCIGYYQSIERFKPATLFTILRGIVIITLSFMYLPVVCGIKGIWMAVPLSELITFVIIVVYYLLKRRRA